MRSDLKYNKGLILKETVDYINQMRQIQENLMSSNAHLAQKLQVRAVAVPVAQCFLFSYVIPSTLRLRGIPFHSVPFRLFFHVNCYAIPIAIAMAMAMAFAILRISACKGQIPLCLDILFRVLNPICTDY